MELVVKPGPEPIRVVIVCKVKINPACSGGVARSADARKKNHPHDSDGTDHRDTGRLPFRSTRRPRPDAARAAAWLGVLPAGLFLLALAGAMWFVATARQVSIHPDPAPDALSLAGGWITPRIGDHYLLRPGSYTLQAALACHRDIAQRFDVGADDRQEIRLACRNSPASSAFRPIQTAGPGKHSRRSTSPSTVDRSALLR